MMMIMEYHNPVLLKETVEGLNIQPDGVYVDVTFGGGGHSKEILERLGKNGKLLAFDQDKDALKNAIDDPRFTLINQNFRFLKRYLRFYGHTKVDGILGDFGVSSHQFDVPERGFSTRFEADLDMRMNQDSPLSAYQVVNDYDEKILGDVELCNRHLKAVYSVGSTSLLYAHVLFNIDSYLIDIRNEKVHPSSYRKFYSIAKYFGIETLGIG